MLLATAVLSSMPVQLIGQETVDSSPVDADSALAAIASAQAARQLAAEARYEWLETGSLITQAQTAADNGQWQQAVALAEQARRQGELSLEQARRESVAWRDRVVR